MKKLLIAGAISVGALFGPFAIQAQAQVVINGYRFEGQELAELEYLLGSPVPPGSYWLDMNTGDWGYQGDSTVQGNLFSESGSSAAGGSQGRADSYYESSGSSYSSYASDGECAYFSTEYGSISTCD